MSITFNKSVEHNSEIVGKFLTYSFTIKNTTKYKLTSVLVSDKLNTNLEFVEASVEVNNIAVPNANIKDGIEVGEMDINSTVYVSFKAYVKNNDKSSVINTGYLIYKYIDEETEEEVSKMQDSNEVSVSLYIAEIACESLTKKNEATLGDIIEYSIKLKNTGDITTTQVMFFDEIPKSLQFVDGSFKLNGKSLYGVSLEDGVYLGDMEEDDTFYVSYYAKVLSGSYTGVATNKAYTKFSYILDNLTEDKFGEVCSHEIKLDILSFKQMIVNEYMCLTCDSPDIEAIDSVLTNVIIDNYYTINTKPSVSFENQYLSYYKLIIHGTINISVIYTGLETEQPIHSINQQFPFSSYIILPLDYTDQNIELSTIVEDTTINQIDYRCLEASVAMLIVARFKD